MIKLEELSFNEKDEDKIILVTKAIASETRLQILKLLTGDEFDISKLATELNQTEANVSAQVKQLERAGLLTSRYEPGDHGVRKICKTAISKISIEIFNNGTT